MNKREIDFNHEVRPTLKQALSCGKLFLFNFFCEVTPRVKIRDEMTSESEVWHVVHLNMNNNLKKIIE